MISPGNRPKTRAEKALRISLLAEARRAFDKDTPEQKKKRRERAQDDFEFFCTTYLPHYFSQPAAQFHRQLIDMALHYQRVAVAAPRGHAKSTVMSFAYPLWAVLTGRKKFLCIFSASHALAGSFLSSIREELEENAKIIGDFGDQRGGPPWSSRTLRLKDGQRLRAFGAGERFRGIKNRQHRPDLIICDDLEEDEAVESKPRREKLKAWYLKGLVNTLDPAGSIFVIGTILHEASLLSELLENEQYERRLWKAIQDDSTALWPERWSLTALEAMRAEIGALNFEQEYQQNPAREGIFRREWIRYYDPAAIKGKRLDVYMAVDPAISKTTTADYSAIVVVGVDRETGDVYVLYVFRARLSVLDQIAKVFEVALRYKPLRIGIETTAYQKALKQFIDERSKRERFYLPTEELKHDSDKVRRIMTLSPLTEQGVLNFTEAQVDLVDELLLFPRAAHDDQSDALEMSVSLARRMGGDWKPLHGRRRVVHPAVMKEFLGADVRSRREMFAGYGL